ncbi:bile acid:sodium symporter family protein [Aureibacillus halotolerans]|uniref:Putative Na+-dependent transporter n=1 Tax=Aureibacillus halotolerans TaxID=1508390 RepID=A0A4R6TT21_9BACI|nr:bile acid:sodium symporter family protein [Aureibacillus halotolerans]TDQ33731.1 putative Na+-dependent transporter [Aureibacillus halotolerans]
MLDRLNRSLEKALPFLTPVAVILGVLFSGFFSIYVPLVPFIFSFITFASTLAISPSDLTKIVKHPLPIIVSLGIIQGILPLLAYLVGHLFFSNDVNTMTGLVLAFAIPTGIVSLMWVSIFNGSRSLTLAIILANMIISPFVLPLTLNLLFGGQIAMDTFGVMEGLVYMVVLPSAAGIFVNFLRKGKTMWMSKRFAPFSKLCLLVVIMINGSIAAPYFKDVNGMVVELFFVVLALAITGYFLGLGFSKWLSFSSETAISVMFNCGMRNIGVGAAIAVVYFPPAVSLPVIIGALFQQIVAALAGRMVSKRLNKTHTLQT